MREQGSGGGKSFNAEFIERPLETDDRLDAGRCMDSDLGNEGVEIRTDFFTRTDERIDAHPRASRPLNCPETSGCRHKFISGVFAGDAHFDSVASHRGNNAEGKTVGDAKLFGDKV